MIASNLTQRATPEGWALERRMIPHMNILAEHVKMGLEMNLVGTVNELAEAYFAHGRYLEAQALFQRVLADQERSLGMDHPSTQELLSESSSKQSRGRPPFFWTHSFGYIFPPDYEPINGSMGGCKNCRLVCAWPSSMRIAPQCSH